MNESAGGAELASWTAARESMLAASAVGLDQPSCSQAAVTNHAVGLWNESGFFDTTASSEAGQRSTLRSDRGTDGMFRQALDMPCLIERVRHVTFPKLPNTTMMLAVHGVAVAWLRWDSLA